MPKQIGTIILGAGASSRMGTPKQLLEWQGESLVNRAIREAKALECGPVVLVLGANARLIQDTLVEADLLVAINENWSSGMGSSIVAGLEKLLQIEPALGAVLISLVDQPLINSTHLQLLIKKWQEKKVPLVAAFYEKSLGVPALFSTELFPELLTLSGKMGAKKIIHKYKDQLAELALPAAQIDVDTPEEWKSFLAQKNFGNF